MTMRRTSRFNPTRRRCSSAPPVRRRKQQQHGGGIEQERHDQDKVAHRLLIGAAEQARQVAHRAGVPKMRVPRPM